MEIPASTPSPQRLHQAGTAAGCTDGRHPDPQEHDAQPGAKHGNDDAGAAVSALASLQVGSVISYVIAIVIPALDAVIPVLPSETVIIALGVATAGSADPRIALLVACAALGAFLGDNLSYLIGRRFGPRVERRFFRGEKGARRRAWAEGRSSTRRGPDSRWRSASRSRSAGWSS